jgi:ankyrin repeat protein
VQRGLSVHAVDSSGCTLLIMATGGGHKAAAEWLLQQGVAVNAADNYGKSSLHCASGDCNSDDAAMVELLLASGADVHKCTPAQYSALDAAADIGNVQCARALIAAGIDVNHFNSLNMTSLHMAILEQHSAVAQLLLEHGATAVMNSVVVTKCTKSCCDSATALMMCTEVNTVKLLLTAGADVHVINDVGDTCLHVAAKHNWKAPMLCLLIKAGADLHAVNSEGQTAAQIAHDEDHTLIEQLLNRAAQQG